MYDPRTLSDLLAPIASDVFLRDYWGEKPLHIAGAPGKLSSLFDLATFERLAATHPSHEIKAHYPDRDGEYSVLVSGASQAMQLFAAGLSVYMAEIGPLHPRLQAFEANLKVALSHPGNCKAHASLSAPGKGVGLHYDDNDFFVVQLEGSKLWKYMSVPARNVPAYGFAASSVARNRRAREAHPEFAEVLDLSVHDLEVPTDAQLHEQLLSPGDVLYLPPRTWHRTAASAEVGQHSLSLTIVMDPWHAFDVVEKLLLRHFDDQYAWWRTAPVCLPEQLPPTGLPANVRAFFDARLEDVRSMLGRLTSDDLFHLWNDAVRDFAFPEEPSLTTTPLDAPGVRPDDVLHRAFPLTYAFQGAHDGKDAAVTLYWLNQELQLDGPALPFVMRLVQASSFKAADTTKWDDSGPLDWDDVAALLDNLVGSGVLTRG